MKSFSKNIVYIICVNILFGTFFLCCKKKDNEKLYNESKATDLLLYKGKDTIYGPKGGSPHGSFKIKFNATAKAALGADGKLPAGSEFPKGSLIVKEVFSGKDLDLYAVMKKDPTSKYASNGWVWAEYKPNGNTVYNISRTGSGCTSCHLTSPSRDLTRLFDLH